MTDKKFNFTDKRLLEFKNDTGKRILVYDTKQSGLALRVTPAGMKTFKFSTWDSTRKRSVDITLGTYPKVSLNGARIRALELASDLAAGVDVVGQNLAERDVPTLDGAFDRWVEKKASKGRTSWKNDRLRYDKHIKPRFGNRKVNDITPRQIENWFLKLPEKTGLSTTSANRLLVIIKTTYNQELRQYPNPCDGLSLNREESRERFLRPAELPDFFDALNSEETPEYLRDFVYLALYCGARKANLLGMRWQDLDLELAIWVVPAANSKNRTSMTIPLIPAVLEILVRRWQGNQSSQRSSLFVFPAINTKGNTGHMNDIRNSWDALLKRAGITNFRIHDLRRSLGSWQTITGASTAIVGKSLGHKSQQATAVYSRLHLDPIRQSMAKAVSAMEATRDLPGKIIPLKKGQRNTV